MTIRTIQRTGNLLANAILIGFCVFALAVVAVLLGGCAKKSSGQDYQNAVSVYSAAVTATVTASRSGQIPVDDYMTWETSVRKPASVMLDEWAAALVAGKPYTGVDALNALLDAMVVENLKRQKHSKGKERSDASEHSDRDHDRAGGGEGRLGDLRHDQAGQRREAGPDARGAAARHQPEEGRRRSGRGRGEAVARAVRNECALLMPLKWKVVLNPAVMAKA